MQCTTRTPALLVSNWSPKNKIKTVFLSFDICVFFPPMVAKLLGHKYTLSCLDLST